MDQFKISMLTSENAFLFFRWKLFEEICSDDEKKDRSWWNNIVISYNVFRYFFAIIFFPFTCQPGDDTSRMLGNPLLSLESCTTGSSKSLLFGRYFASNRKVSPVYREGFFQMVLKSCSSTQFIAFWWIAIRFHWSNSPTLRYLMKHLFLTLFILDFHGLKARKKLDVEILSQILMSFLFQSTKLLRRVW